MQGVDQVIRLLELTVQLGNRPQRIDVAGIDLQHFLPGIQRLALALQLLAPDLAQALVERDALLGDLGDPHRALEDVDELAPHLRRLVEHRQRTERHRVFAA